uniref:Uncharacterized protein n=1 Tax=Arundo donax TaxID=35708 RepID=A0A0A8Y2L4_ARUDO
MATSFKTQTTVD